MAYELWELRPHWYQNSSRTHLLERLRRSRGSLGDGVSIPIEVDLLDFVPGMIDPDLNSGTKEADAEAIRVQAAIQKAIAEYGVWLSRDGRNAVTRAGVHEDG